MRKLLAFVIFALIPIIGRGEGYICVTDLATGFSYKDGSWRTTAFTPSEKYLIHRADSPAAIGIKAARWYVSEPGSKAVTAACYEDFDNSGNLFCKQQDGFNVEHVDFRMNKNSLRFLYAHLAGYWDRTPGTESGDTPYVVIGKCMPM